MHNLDFMKVVPRTSSQKSKQHSWKKVLYETHQYDDNYTHSTFLSLLRKNESLHLYTWAEAALPLCSITSEIASTLLYIAVFAFLDEGLISPRQIVWISVIFVVTFLLLQFVTHVKETLKCYEVTVLHILSSGIVLLISGYMFTPIVKSLTETVSTDTIYAMVAIMLLVHVLFQEYFPSSLKFYSCLSLNSSIFAAVCLASRLATEEHTFVFTTFAFQIFICVSFFRVIIQDCPAVFVCFTGLLSVLVILTLAYLRPACVPLFILVCGFINLYCPRMYVKCQRYKESIHGPWDEAVIKEEIA